MYLYELAQCQVEGTSMVLFVPNSITFRDMNYYPVTDGQGTDGQKAMHKSPSCNMHRWAQKLMNEIAEN